MTYGAWLLRQPWYLALKERQMRRNLTIENKTTYYVHLDDKDLRALFGLRCHDTTYPHHYDTFQLRVPARDDVAWPAFDLTGLCRSHGERRIDLDTWKGHRAVRSGYQRERAEETP